MLNESFAEFAANWAAASATRHTSAWARHLTDQKLEAYLADQGPVSHPIRQPIRDVAQAMSIFDAITYPRARRCCGSCRSTSARRPSGPG